MTKPKFSLDFEKPLRNDAAKVARIREQLSAGTYEINDTKLAKAMLERELGWTRP